MYSCHSLSLNVVVAIDFYVANMIYSFINVVHIGIRESATFFKFRMMLSNHHLCIDVPLYPVKPSQIGFSGYVA